MTFWTVVGVLYLAAGLALGAWWWALLQGDFDEEIEGSEVGDLLGQMRFMVDNDPRGAALKLILCVATLCVVLLWPLVALSMIFAKPGRSGGGA
jgi:hypothetical protein